MERLYLVCAVGGLAATVLALVSRAIHRLPFSGPLAAILLGIVLGPQLMGLLELEPELHDTLLLEGARLLLAGSVMTAALRFPTTALSALVRPLVLLLVVVMPLAALAAGAAALLLGLPLALAALVGACLCPTDPVLAASVITGEPAERDLPGRIRALLTGESGANDGLALPLAGIARAVVLPATHLGDAFGKVAWEAAGGVVIGLLAGLAAGWALRAATRHRDLEEGPKLVFTLLLAVSVLGIARLAGTGGVLAVFVAGLAYNRMVAESDRDPQDAVDKAVNRYAVLPLFLVFGAVLPWRDGSPSARRRSSSSSRSCWCGACRSFWCWPGPCASRAVTRCSRDGSAHRRQRPVLPCPQCPSGGDRPAPVRRRDACRGGSHRRLRPHRHPPGRKLYSKSGAADPLRSSR